MTVHMSRCGYGYEKVFNYYIDCIYKFGLLLDDHDIVLRQFCLPATIKPDSNWSLNISKTVTWSTLVLPCITGVCSICIPLVTLIPMGIHYLLLKLEKIRQCKWKQDFYELNLTMRKQYELNRAIQRYYEKHMASIANLKPVTRHMVEKIITPKMNEFLHSSGDKIQHIIRKVTNLIQQVDALTCIGEMNCIYFIPDEFHNRSPARPADQKTIIHYYQTCVLCYSFTASSLLCSVALGLCHPENPAENRDYNKLFGVVINEATRIAFACYEELSEEFRNIALSPIDLPLHSSFQLATKLTPINNVLYEFMRNIQITFDIARVIQLELGQSDNYLNIGYVLEDHYTELRRLFTNCRNSLKYLKQNINTLVNADRSEAIQRQQVMESRTEAELEENTTDAAEQVIIKHNDPDTPASTEEYNLSVHGSDDDNNEETNRPTDYCQLLDYIRTQKIMIQELNIELRKRKLITQDENVTSQLDEKREFESMPPTLQFNFAMTTCQDRQQQQPLSSFSETELDFGQDMQFYHDIAAQVQAVANNWHVNEEIFEDDN